MAIIKYSHGCVIYAIIFCLCPIVGISAGPDSFLYSFTGILLIVWMILCIPFFIFWHFLIKKNQQKNANKSALFHQQLQQQQTKQQQQQQIFQQQKTEQQIQQFITSFTKYLNVHKRSLIRDCATMLGLERDQLLQLIGMYSHLLPPFEINGNYILAKSNKNEIDEPLPMSQKICSYCGAKNSSTDKYCIGCGAIIEEIQNEDGTSRYIPSDVRKAVWERDGGKCVRCGSSKSLQYDHIIPFSKGGANTAENLQLLCANCNTEKHDKIEG